MQKLLQTIEGSPLTSCGVKMGKGRKVKSVRSVNSRQNSSNSTLTTLDLGAIKSKQIRVRLVRSVIGRKPNQRKTVKALGLKKINSFVEKDVNDAILGMVRTVSHLVEVEEIS